MVGDPSSLGLSPRRQPALSAALCPPCRRSARRSALRVGTRCPPRRQPARRATLGVGSLLSAPPSVPVAHARSRSLVSVRRACARAACRTRAELAGPSLRTHATAAVRTGCWACPSSPWLIAYIAQQHAYRRGLPELAVAHRVRAAGPARGGVECTACAAALCP